MTTLSIKIAPNAEMYLDQIRTVVQFKLGSPDKVLKKFFPDMHFSIKEYLKLEYNRMTAA